MDQLRNALKQALGDDPPEPAPPEAAGPPAAPALPDPLASPWGIRLRELGAEIPRGPTMGQLTQRSDALGRDLQARGRRRDADELRKLKEQFLRQREGAAWAAVKARFEALSLPEKAYRALKQEGADAEKVLQRLYARRAEGLVGAGAARVRDELLGS